jgi:hypothetical protein
LAFEIKEVTEYIMKRLTIAKIRSKGKIAIIDFEDLFILDPFEERQLGAILERNGYVKTTLEAEPEEKPEQPIYFKRS